MSPANPDEIDPSGTWVVVAAYNEASAVRDVVKELKAGGFKVAVVDDGSGDDTASVAADAGAVVIQHPINLGQGAALQTGIEFTLRLGAQFVVTFDADGQHRASDIPLLISALVDTGDDIACGRGRVRRRVLDELETVGAHRVVPGGELHAALQCSLRLDLPQRWNAL